MDAAVAELISRVHGSTILTVPYASLVESTDG